MTGLIERFSTHLTSSDNFVFIVAIACFTAGTLIGWLWNRVRSIHRIATLEAMLEMEIQSGEERIASMHQAFAGISSQALKDNNAQFLDLARQTFSRFAGDADHSLKMRQQAVDQLVSPLRDALLRTEQKITEFDLGQKENQGQLKQQIEGLSTQHIKLEQETRRLVNALRRPEVRGRWGELSLRRLVELSGMVPNCDFSEQISVNDNSDRPDMVIHLPENRQVIVDAKAPIDAYLSALDADQSSDKERFLDLHAAQVRKRVSALSRNALESKIILATPTSLVALLRTIAHGWSQQKLNQHALQIRHAAEEYHQRLATFSEHFDGIGKHLSRLVDAYGQSVGSFERKLMPIARQFSTLGLRKGKTVTPPRHIEGAHTNPPQHKQ